MRPVHRAMRSSLEEARPLNDLPQVDCRSDAPARTQPWDDLLVYWSVRNHPSRRPFARTLKRALDVAIASSAILVLAPVLLLIAMMVKCTSEGPVLFRQPRFGLRLRPFTILKFRTMVANADERREEISQLNEARGCIFKIRKDPRLTPVGRVLRRTSLDELPQLLNVLRGDMSLVGPRPLPDWVLRGIEEHRFHRRFAVLPGITGLWQVSGRVQDSQRMLEDDLQYVENWTWWLDLRILLATPTAMFQDTGQFLHES